MRKNRYIAYTQLLLLLSMLTPSDAWTFTASDKTSFLTSAPIFTASPKKSSKSLTMDIEQPAGVKSHPLKMPKVSSKLPDIPRCSRTTPHAIDQAAAEHGMPWQNSIDPSYQSLADGSNKPFYMAFWEWQIQFMKEHLTNLQVLSVTSQTGNDLSFVQNTQKGMRLHTLQCSSDEYKTIRLTVMDAGNKIQVFTSLWYPQPEYNLPVLGIDLLQFNQAKHLCIVDFQPIHEAGEAAHAQSYEHWMQPIRDQYLSLQGKMTNRFYNEDSFFSKQMLLGRSGRDGAQQMVFEDLFPAYRSYVQAHVNMVRSTTPSSKDISEVLKCHAAYDNYSAARDPAHGLLASAFGQEFADDYVYDILFPLSVRP